MKTRAKSSLLQSGPRLHIDRTCKSMDAEKWEKTSSKRRRRYAQREAPPGMVNPMSVRQEDNKKTNNIRQDEARIAGKVWEDKTATIDKERRGRNTRDKTKRSELAGDTTSVKAGEANACKANGSGAELRADRSPEARGKAGGQILISDDEG